MAMQAELRIKAEAIARAGSNSQPDSPESASATHALRELQVHQIALELQHEELQRTKADLTEARQRNGGLYDLAPVGYCTLDAQGLILQANLAAAGLLGVAREHLIQQPISRFILSEERDIHLHCASRLPEASKPLSCDVRVLKADGTFFWAHILIADAQDSEGGHLCHLVMSDITERARLGQAEVFLAKAEWLAKGEDFFHALARFLAGHLAMDYICIDRLSGDALSAETLAVWFDGRFEDNVEYTLKDTPCGQVVGKSICCFPAGVRHLFPKDQVLQDMGAESYLGVTLFGLNGNPIGLIALIGRTPVADSHLAESTLALIAVRAAAELERKQNENELREANQFKEEILLSAREGIIVHDRALRYRVWNPFMEHLTGLPASQVVGKHPMDLFPFLGEADVIGRLEKVLAGESVESVEIPFLIPGTGKPGWGTDSISPLRDSKGEIIGVITMVRDVTRSKEAELDLQQLNLELEARILARTAELSQALEVMNLEIQERRKAEAALELEKEKFRTVADLTFDWEEWLAPSGSAVYISPSCERITGYSPQEFQNDPGLFLRIVHPDDVQIVDSTHRDLIEHHHSKDLEFRICTRQGETRWISHLCVPVFGANGAWLGQRSSNRDISDRKAAEEAIRLSEAKYSTVVENSPTGIFILRDEKIMFANRRFFEILQRPPEAMATLQPREILHPDDVLAMQEIWHKRLVGIPSPQDSEFRILAGGSVRWIMGRSVAIPFDQGMALLINIHDTTERHEAITALRISEEALHGLSARMISIQELERQRVARELHDSIGSTLSAIKLMVERSLDLPCPHELNCHVAALRSVIPVIQDSVEEVRRISMALHPLILDDLGLITTIEWFVREFQLRLPQVWVELRVEVEEREVPHRLKTNIFRILQEGLNNVAKYSQASRVGVGLRVEEGQIILEITDNGVGFEVAALPQPDAKGGFGLASMRERIELSSGELSILTGPGKGTKIRASWHKGMENKGPEGVA